MKIYSNQNVNAEQIIPFPDEVHTTELDWWMIYDADTKVITIQPLQCSGYTSSPLTMVIADTEEELEQYIADHGLKIGDS
ncbi:hypothetical protein EBQ91_05670 [bacterium]|nr:hypothetical protein [bacterium]